MSWKQSKEGILTAKKKFLKNNAKALNLKAKILNLLKKPEDHLQPSVPKGSHSGERTKVTAQVFELRASQVHL